MYNFGKRFIDIGCNDGLHSIMAEQWGATEVIAIDCFERKNTRFIIDHFDSKVKYYVMDICDREQMKSLGKFDTIIFCGVFYHLIDPLAAIFNIRDLLINNGGTMLFESWANSDTLSNMEFIAETHHQAPVDKSCWWIPSNVFLEQFLAKIGFKLSYAGFGDGPYSSRWSAHALYNDKTEIMNKNMGR